MKLPHRRQFMHLAAGAAALPAVSRIVWAQAYPTRPLTLVVPFAAGGPSDGAARIIGQRMSEILRQQVVVENLTGAGGTVGSLRVAKATPDGYQFVLGPVDIHLSQIMAPTRNSMDANESAVFS